MPIGMNQGRKERGFSVELNSHENVNTISFSENTSEKVLIEGTLGELKDLGFLESVVLEMKGAYGTLMLDLAEEELRNMVCKKKEVKK